MPQVTYIGLPALLKRGADALEGALDKAAEDLVGRAQSAAPVDTGTLRASIHVGGVGRQGNASSRSRSRVVSTGGESSEYAIFQHEGTSRGVPATKFLEVPLLEMAPVYHAYLQQAMRSAF